MPSVFNQGNFRFSCLAVSSSTFAPHSLKNKEEKMSKIHMKRDIVFDFTSFLVKENVSVKTREFAMIVFILEVTLQFHEIFGKILMFSYTYICTL